MRMNGPSRLAACVVVLAVVAVGAFASGGTDTGATGSTTAVSASDLTPYGRYAETVTLSVGKVLYQQAKFPAGKSSRDNAALDMFKRELNVQYNVLWEVPAEEYRNKLSLVIAAGEMPDIMFFNTPEYMTFKTLVKEGVIADLTDAYRKCAGAYMKQVIGSYVGDRFEPLTFNGKIYAYPNSNLGYNHNLLWVRGDWLKKVNLPVPRTIDDIKAIARAFIAQDPGGNGAGNTVGIPLNAKVPLAGFSNYLGAEPLAHALGAFPRTWMKDASGKVYYGSVAPEMKQVLSIMADMYREGLLDKAFMTRVGSGETDGLINDNRTGLFFAPWWAGWPRHNMVKNHPEADWLVVNAPLNQGGKYVHLGAPTTELIMAINAKVKHPEAVIKCLNVGYDAVRGFNAAWKAEIQPYLEAGTLWQAMMPTGDINLEYYDVLPRVGKLVKNYVQTGVMEAQPTTTEYDKSCAVNAKRYVDSKDPNDLGWIDYLVRGRASTILDTPENVELKAAFTYSTASMAELMPALRSLEEATILRIITGDKPVSYFDEFVAEWKKSGGEKLTQEVQAAIAK